MRRLKIWGAGAGVLALIFAIAIGVFGYKAGEKSNDNLLTTKAVVKTFKNQGLPLKINKSEPAEEHALEGIKPAIYHIGDKEDLLLIYEFKSFGEKKEALKRADKYNIEFYFLHFEYPFHAKNMLMVLKSVKEIETKEELDRLGGKLKSIKEIVFKDLNEGKKRFYHGESANWEGTFTFKYYEHWHQDDGTLRLDSHYEGKPTIKFKNIDQEDPNPISLEYRIGSSRSISSGIRVDEDGYLEIGGSSGNGLIPTDEEVPFIIKWGDQEEEIILKVKAEK